MSDQHEPTRDDYLWDRSGPVDAGIERLERLLGAYALPAARGVRGGTPLPRKGKSHRRRRRRHGIPMAIAAAAVIVAIAITGGYRHRLQWPAGQAWQLSMLSGEARIDGRAQPRADALEPGSVLETGTGDVVRLQAARIGEVVIGADSRFGLVETRSGHHRVQLQRGSLWARVWAPPGALAVATPNADVIDMGCEFLLRVDEEGGGQLTVNSGWVQVDNGRREVLVPQGARVELRSDGTSGVPYDLGASAAFIATARAIDAQGLRAAADGEDARTLVATARTQDAITLLSLLQRYPHLGDGPVFDRVQRDLPAEAKLTREYFRTHRTEALNLWWRQLPYPPMKRWWLKWPDAFGRDGGAAVLLDESPR